MSNRGWVPTFTGHKLNPTSINPKDITIEDIGHHLSLQCRFAGATEKLCSVAQHSVMVAEYVWTETHSTHDALWGLLHDAAEAYVQDINIAVKDLIKVVYDPLEERLLETIIAKYGLTWPEPEVVKRWDWIVGCNEAFSFIKKGSPKWFGVEPVQKIYMTYWTAEYAEKAFVENFYHLSEDL
jgi:hypothetical protein